VKGLRASLAVPLKRPKPFSTVYGFGQIWPQIRTCSRGSACTHFYASHRSVAASIICRGRKGGYGSKLPPPHTPLLYLAAANLCNAGEEFLSTLATIRGTMWRKGSPVWVGP
jgi:hypothetical protein